MAYSARIWMLWPPSAQRPVGGHLAIVAAQGAAGLDGLGRRGLAAPAAQPPQAAHPGHEMLVQQKPEYLSFFGCPEIADAVQADPSAVRSLLLAP